jgi:YD repeat-containing protein
MGAIKEIRKLQIKYNSSQILKTQMSYQYPANDGAIITMTPPLPMQGTRITKLNPDGTTKETIDPDGQKTVYNYASNFRRVTSLVRYKDSANSQAVTVQYGYDSFDRLTSITDAKGIKTEYIYDDFGRLVEIKSPDNASPNLTNSDPIKMEYDNRGLLIKKKQQNGEVIHYTYDGIGRLTNIDYPAPAAGADSFLTDNDVEFFYGENSGSQFTNGRLTRIRVKMYNAASGEIWRTTNYDYDAAGRVKSKAITDGSISYTTSYSYKLNDQLESISYPFMTG